MKGKKALVWETAVTYTPKPLKKFDKTPAPDYDPTGVPSVGELIARAEQGMLVPVYPLEYGESEDVNPAYKQDRDLVDLQHSLKETNIEEKIPVTEEKAETVNEADVGETNAPEKPSEDV